MTVVPQVRPSFGLTWAQVNVQKTDVNLGHHIEVEAMRQS